MPSNKLVNLPVLFTGCLIALGTICTPNMVKADDAGTIIIPPLVVRPPEEKNPVIITPSSIPTTIPPSITLPPGATPDNPYGGETLPSMVVAVPAAGVVTGMRGCIEAVEYVCMPLSKGVAGPPLLVPGTKYIGDLCSNGILKQWPTGLPVDLKEFAYCTIRFLGGN